jgi:hypothetical protein
VTCRTCKPRGAWLAGLLAVMVLAGCQAGQPTEPGGAVEAMRGHVVGAVRQPTELDVNAAYATLNEWQAKFVVVGERAGPASLVATVRRVDDEQAPWRRDMANGQVQHLRQAGPGVIEMVAVEDDKHDVISLFAPPLVVMDAGLTPGEPRRIESEVRVVKRGNRSQQVDQGRCVWSIVYDGDQRVRTPAGTFDCKRIRTEYRGRFTAAQVTSVTHAYPHETLGLIAESYRENGAAFFVPWSKSRTILRAN